MTGKICGTGSYAPSHIVNNDDLSKIVDTNDAWIRERTGVIRRHIIEKETTVSMAVQAAKRALDDAGIRPEEIELLIVSTFTSEVVLPCTACEVQKELGAVHATCFDLNAACTGLLFAYNTAQAYITAGMYRTALLIGSESLSNAVNWKDRGTCILFGDGAGAAVMKAAEDKQERKSLPAVTHSNGAKGGALTMMSRHRKDWEPGEKDDASLIRMDGQEIFKFAVKQVPEIIREVLEKAELNIEDIDYFILHQSNKRIVESVSRRLGVGIEKFPMNLQEYGNTSSASIPILLDEMNRKGMLDPGMRLVAAGFGAGLSWGAALIEW